MDVDSARLTEQEERTNEVIAAFLAAAQAGEHPDPQQWLTRHPDLADELASFFAAKAGFEQQAGPLIPTEGEPDGPDMPPLAPGETPQVGDYLLLEEIARGGMGVVYRAWQKSLGRTVAVKMIRAGELASAEDVRRFRAEAEVAASLDHPGIVPIYEVGQHGRQHFFSMRLIEGGSLAAVKHRESAATKESQRWSARLLAEVARAVHHAHQRGLLHRDLKPANILLDTDGRPLVSDFGLAKRVAADGAASGAAHLTHSNAVVGTAAYMAPEQAAGRARQLTTAADVYSLGAILYELLTGAPPFRDDNTLAVLRAVQEREPVKPRSVVASIAADLETICLKCLEKEPTRRYGSAETLAEDLERFLGGEPIRARPASHLERVGKWARRRPGIAALTTTVLAVTLMGMGGMTWQWQEARDEEDKALHAKADAENKAVQAQIAQLEAERLGKAEREAKKQAQAERDRTAQALKRAEGLHLTAQASIALPSNPSLALLLAAEGVRRAPGLLANNTLRAALDACHEERPAGAGVDNAATALQSRSANGSRILNTSGAGIVEVSRADTGKVILSLQGPGTNSLLAALSADGKLVAFVPPTTWVLTVSAPEKGADQFWYTDRVPRVWDVDTGKQVAVLKGHASRVGFLAFSPDSRSLVTTSYDLTARVWDARTGKESALLRGFTSYPGLAAFSPDGRRLLTVTSGQTAQFRYPDGNPYPDQDLSFRAPAAKQRFIDPPELLSTNPVIWEVEKKGTWTPLVDQGVTSSNKGDLAANLWDTATGKEVQLRGQGFGASPFGVGPLPVTGAFTPDGRAILAYKGTRLKARVWDAASGKLLLTCRDEEPLPNCATVAISPDGTQVLSCAGRLAYLDPIADRSKEKVLKGHTGEVRTGRFSPDGRRVVTAGKDRTVRVWDVESGEEELVLRGSPMVATDVRFSPDGQRILCFGDTGETRVWRLQAEPPQARLLVGHYGAVRTLDFSPDGTQLVTGGQDGTAVIWDAANGNKVAVYRPPSLGEVLREAMPSHPFVNLLTDDASFPKGQWSNGMGPYGEVVSVQFSPDGNRILFLARTNNMYLQRERGQPMERLPFVAARILDAATGRQRVALQGDGAEPLSAAFSPDGKWVVTTDGGFFAGSVTFNTGVGTTASGGGINPRPVVRVQDAATGKALCRLEHKMVLGAVFTPAGDRVVTQGVNCVRVWEVPAGKKLWHLGIDHEVQPAGTPPWDGNRNPRPNLSPFPGANPPADTPPWDGNRNPPAILSPLPGANPQSMPDPQGPYAGQLQPGQTPNLVVTPATPPVADPGVNGPAVVSPDGKRLLVQQPARILELATGKEVCRLEGHVSPLPEMSLSGTGQAMRWSVQVLPSGPAKVSPFSPDGRWVVAPSNEPKYAVAIWDADTGKVACQLRGHLGFVLMARFSADGRFIATVSEDETARVWDAVTAKELHTLTGHQGAVLFAAFSPDSKRLATAGVDGTTRVWELDLLALTEKRRPRHLTPEERQRYEVEADK